MDCTEGRERVEGASEEVAAAGGIRGDFGLGLVELDDVALKMRGGIDGTQHVGTEKGFGGTKARTERGRRQWLANCSSAAVVNVIANATAKRVGLRLG